MDREWISTRFMAGYHLSATLNHKAWWSLKAKHKSRHVPGRENVVRRALVRFRPAIRVAVGRFPIKATGFQKGVSDVEFKFYSFSRSLKLIGSELLLKRASILHLVKWVASRPFASSFHILQRYVHPKVCPDWCWDTLKTILDLKSSSGFGRWVDHFIYYPRSRTRALVWVFKWLFLHFACSS